jgi:hypothetical protein
LQASVLLSFSLSFGGAWLEIFFFVRVAICAKERTKCVFFFDGTSTLARSTLLRSLTKKEEEKEEEK